MKLTLKNIRSLKKESDSPLTKYVCNYVIGKWGDYSDKIHIFTDVLHYGCQSGVVGSLMCGIRIANGAANLVTFSFRASAAVSAGSHEVRL